MNTLAVIGAGFGDEGKGKVVSHLCLRHEPALVVRYCGGQQAGHKVMVNGLEHIFSNFGSGTLQGIPTLWSKFCTIDPVGILNEAALLYMIGVKPTLYIDSRCPVTTPFEKAYNQQSDKLTGHGTCGVGLVKRTKERKIIIR